MTEPSEGALWRNSLAHHDVQIVRVGYNVVRYRILNGIYTGQELSAALDQFKDTYEPVDLFAKNPVNKGEKWDWDRQGNRVEVLHVIDGVVTYKHLDKILDYYGAQSVQWFTENLTKSAPRMPDELIDIHNENFDATHKEIIRQVTKWGIQHLSDVMDSCLSGDVSEWYGLPSEEDAKQVTDDRMKAGTHTWSDILIEEVVEAINSNPGTPEMETELIQVAAVCWSWIADIRSRAWDDGGDLN